MKNFILEEMDKLGADGVDFVPIFTPINKINANIILSKTRQEIIDDPSYPKTGRRYWKIINGKTVYLNND